MNKDYLINWLSHPVTKAYFNYLMTYKRELQDALLSGSLTARLNAEQTYEKVNSLIKITSFIDTLVDEDALLELKIDDEDETHEIITTGQQDTSESRSAERDRF